MPRTGRALQLVTAALFVAAVYSATVLPPKGNVSNPSGVRARALGEEGDQTGPPAEGESTTEAADGTTRALDTVTKPHIIKVKKWMFWSAVVVVKVIVIAALIHVGMKYMHSKPTTTTTPAPAQTG